MRGAVSFFAGAVAIASLAWSCGGESAGDNADASSSGGDATVADAGGVRDGGTLANDGSGGDAPSGDAGDGGCQLPANTCDDGIHLRVRSNLRTDAGTDGGDCAWDEEVVDCSQMGGEVCFGGQCTVIVR